MKELPDGWEYKKIMEIGEVISGSTPKTTNPDYWGGEIDWITPAELINGHNWYYYSSQRKITQMGLESTSCTLFPKGTVMLTSRAPIGKVAIAGKEMCTNQGFKNIICDTNIIDPEYLYYWLRANTKRLLAHGRGATFKEISKRIVENIKLPVPSLETQKKIVAILEKAEQTKSLNEEAEGLIDELLKSVFYDMFGDSVKNEKGWEIVTLEKCCNKITDGTHQPPKFVNKGIPFIFVSNIVNNRIDLETKKFISEDTYNELTKRKPIEIGDVLYTTVGSYGNPAIVETDKKFCFQRHIAHLKPNISTVNTRYLFGVLKSSMVKMQVERRVRGVAQKTLNLKDLNEIKVFLPPMKFQNQFAQIVKKVEPIRKEFELSNQESETLFNALLQKAFTGELVA